MFTTADTNIIVSEVAEERGDDLNLKVAPIKAGPLAGCSVESKDLLSMSQVIIGYRPANQARQYRIVGADGKPMSPWCDRKKDAVSAATGLLPALALYDSPVTQAIESCVDTLSSRIVKVHPAYLYTFKGEPVGVLRGAVDTNRTLGWFGKHGMYVYATDTPDVFAIDYGRIGNGQVIEITIA